jgi:hypothetical protein
MTSRLVALALLVALPLTGTAAQVVAPIAIYVDAPRSSLVGSDFAVTVDEMRLPVSTVSRGPQPLSAIVLLDVSDSLQQIPVVQIGRLSGAVRLGDTVHLGTFADRVVIGSTAIVDGASAKLAEREVTQPGGASPLWDAICASVDALRGAGGLRVVVVFSDARATGNDRSFAETYDMVIHAGVTVSVIGVSDDALVSPGQVQMIGRNEKLRQLARDTGGEYAELRTPHKFAGERSAQDEPATLLIGELNHLRAKTRLEFLPPVRDGVLHRVSVAVDGRTIGGPVRIPF